MLMWLLRLNGTGKANTLASTFLFQGMSFKNLEFHTKTLWHSCEVDVELMLLMLTDFLLG